MAKQYAVLYLTQRGERHQQTALASAPPELAVTMRRSPTKAEIIGLLPGKDFLITERSGSIDTDIIQAGSNLQLIQRLGSMTDDIDLAAAKAAGIPVSSLPVRGCMQVAEHMLMQILACTKRVREMMEITRQAQDFGQAPQVCDEDTFAYNWSHRKDIRGLWGATVGILGFGEIGAELARRLVGFGCSILYHKRNPYPAAVEDELHIRYANPHDLLAASDVVCMLLPFFSETAHTLSHAFFYQMKKGSIFVSCGGSGVVDEQALAAALASGHLYGAAIDTFTHEPIAPQNPLLALAQNPSVNLILTPHIAAGTGLPDASSEDNRHGDYLNILHVIRGEKIIGQLV